MLKISVLNFIKPSLIRLNIDRLLIAKWMYIKSNKVIIHFRVLQEIHNLKILTLI